MWKIIAVVSAYCIAVIGLTTIAVGNANAAIVYESATVGTTGHGGGFHVGFQLLGSRFSLTQATRIDSIGGHVSESGGDGTLWAALFPLANATTALPTFGSLDPAGFAIAYAILSPDNTSSLVTAALTGGAAVLGPGAYGIVIGGGGFFGTTGVGSMPAGIQTGSVNIGSPSYFFSGDGTTWVNGGFSTVRFEVNGEVVSVPEPGPLALFGLGLLGLAACRRRRGLTG